VRCAHPLCFPLALTWSHSPEAGVIDKRFAARVKLLRAFLERVPGFFPTHCHGAWQDWCCSIQNVLRSRSMNIFKFVGVCSDRAARILLFCLVLVLPFPALAVLGDTAASVLNDQARMKGTLRSVDSHTYVMHEITSPSGTVVREFVSPQGAVFGVAWEGQFPPDLQSLLGPYYQQAQKAQEKSQEGSQQPRARRAPIVVETPGLVLYETGHTRSFHGQAYVPQLIPPGVQSSDIR
jgi:hypothetical protein